MRLFAEVRLLAYYGPWPTDVYIHSPTPWSDLYQRYGWAQVHRRLKPVKATILGIHSQPEIIATQRFRNNVTRRVDYKAELSQKVSNTVSNSWNIQHNINVGQLSKWNSKSLLDRSAEQLHSPTPTNGARAAVTPRKLLFQPALALRFPSSQVNQSKPMTASRGTMEIEVVYEATVYGDVAVNYEDTWNGHYFWRYDVNAVMASGGLPRTLQVTETLKVGFYTDVEIEVHEKNGKRKLMANITV
ncbi:LOW QUALITY PROTEIN: uncharacterized protein LOC125236943 [Leguminivora glycinivorella]|uniref:LOW QUALITY PROTEIN: uncharacterized protein LOC125236943 n=1 Tax=Leguminivora glycinivorella TaxID=1035111 RepID=UPI00200D22EE|nr:LOW QUALITY PROTEIN: uncharacterized protein LOC125236943 [Leguminivora glycinivorella]